MRPLALRFLSSLCAASILTASLSASAQTVSPAPAPAPVPAPTPQAPAAQVVVLPPPAPLPASSARQPNGEYTAPIYQTTQPTYIPQSVAYSGPREISDWEEGAPPPPGYHTETRVRRGLIIGGAVTFGCLYLISVLVASAGADDAKYTGRGNEQAAMWAPVAGPFIQMGSTSSTTGNTFLFIDGAAQLAGAAMLIYGLTSEKTVLVRNDLGRPMIVPIRMGRDGMGVGLSGSF